MERNLPFIVSIGNISMGGTGKTPFAIFLAKYFSKLNEKVSILSLGYKGKLGYDTNVISDGKTIFHKPPEAADEPFMMAQELLDNQVSVITGKDRQKSFEVGLRKFGSTVFILDDCFQYKKMPRNLDILLLDHSNPISTGFPFPLGYLREFPSAIKRADIIIFTRAESTIVPKKVEKYCRNKPIYFCEHKYSGFYHNGEHNTDYIIGKRVWLISAIANFNQFKTQIENQGACIVGESKYQDHYFYSENDIEKILKIAESNKVDFIVTTQKDIVKIPGKYMNQFCFPKLNIKMLNNGFENSINNARI